MDPGIRRRLSIGRQALEGQGNVGDEGYGLMLMTYERPEDPQQAWTRELVSNFLHQSHNFHPVNWDTDPEEACGRLERRVWRFDHQRGFWRARQLTDQFAGEIRDGRLPGGRRFMVTIEPMHGITSAIYGEPSVLLPVGPDWQWRFTISSRMDMRWLWTISWELVPIKSSWGGAG